MSFTLPERQTYKLAYDDTTSYPGLTVCLLSSTVDEYLLIGELAELDRNDITAQARLADALGGMLVSWDLLYADGQPVPATRPGLGTVPVELMVTLANDWMMAVATLRQATAGAAADAPAGLGLDEASIPMGDDAL